MNAELKLHEYCENWQDEKNGAALYAAISQYEKNPHLKKVYQHLAEAEERHSKFWESKIHEANQPTPVFHLNWRTRTLMLLARIFGPRFVLPNIVSLEHVDTNKYDQQPEAQQARLPQQEQSHARVLQEIAGSPGITTGSRIARLEGRHRAMGGNAVRAAVLGANDGLLSNFSLVMGVSGANLTNETVLITGIAGLIAGACSMALGEWLSVQSARELHIRQIEVERQELEAIPEEELEELKLIYQAKGLPEKEAQRLADRLIENKSQALNTLAREELGINPEDLGGSPWIAAGSSFALFAAGAIIPVLPFLFASGMTAVLISAVVCTAGLFTFGAGITLFTGRSVLYSGLRQVLFGLAAATITFLLGRVFQTSFSGATARL